MNRLMMLLFAIILLPASVFCQTVTVCKSGCDYQNPSSAYGDADCGDIIEFRDSNTYEERINANKNCSSENKLRIQAGAGFTPVLSYSGAYDANGRIVITGSHHVISGFSIGPVANEGGISIEGGDHNIVENCTLNSINTTNIVAGQGASGILIKDGAEYNIVRNNVVGDCNHGSIELMSILAPVRYNQVLNNVINGRYGHGISILYPDTGFNLIDGNQISNVGVLAGDRGKNGLQLSGGHNNSIRRNVFYNLYNRGMEINAYSSLTAPIQDNYIYNNTFYNIGYGPASTGAQPWILCGIAGSGSRIVSGNKFYNNIADRVGQNPAGGWIGTPHVAFLHGYTEENDAGDSIDEVENINDFNDNILRNNVIRIYYNNSYDLLYASAIHYNSAGSGLQLNYSATSINGKGSNSGNFTDDPKFRSNDTADNNWWHLGPDSNLIDKGMKVIDPNASIGGWDQLRYNGNGPDIGAHESGNASLLSPQNLKILGINQ